MSIEAMRHSLAHVLAMAVQKLYPKAKLGIGPAIDDGFYYDFDDLEIEEKDLKKIEKEMRRIIEQNLEFEKNVVSRHDAKHFLKKEPYKLEILKDIKDEISFYKSGEFEDLCAGPHVKSTKEIGAFKLTRIAGAYWKGESKNKMLTRIYGIAFKTEKEIKDYLKKLEEAEKRNHVKLGKKLDLFSFHPESPGNPFFHHKGLIIWDELMKYWREEHDKENYLMVRTPMVLNKSLWETSGHWEYYKENMYEVIIEDHEEHAIKPMNCPGGMLVYNNSLHSYKELPLKLAEIGWVHRHELSGTLNGLFRVRSFHQDDAHIFCSEGQLQDEIIQVLSLVERMYKTFGLTYKLELSTRPSKSIGSDLEWKHAEKSLKQALKKADKKFELNPGDGAFYGPKIDIHVEDSLGRTWQCGTIQVDFFLPDRFDVNYEGADGKKHRPAMLHRVVFGSFERFLGILIEHYGGNFPVWLAPTQVAIVPVSEKHIAFAKKINQQLVDANVRTFLDDRSESVGKKIRDNTVQKIPFILTIGDKEVKSKKLAIRDNKGKVKFGVKVDDFIKDISKIIVNKKV